VNLVLTCGGSQLFNLPFGVQGCTHDPHYTHPLALLPPLPPALTIFSSL